MISEGATVPKSEASRRVAAGLAWTSCALSATLAGCGLFFLISSGSVTDTFADSVGVDVAVAIAFPAVGAIIASRRPGNVIGWLFCVIGLSQGAAVFAGEYADYALLERPGSLPAGVAAFWFGSWVWVPGVALTLTFLLLLFPSGRLPSRRWRPVAWLSAATTTLGVAVMAVAPWDLIQPDLPVENPLGAGEALVPSLEVAAILLLSLGTTSALLSAFSLALRLKRSRGEERRQLQWFLYAGVLYLLTLLSPVDAVSNLQIVTAPLLPVAAGIAILKHRLYDIDLIINRTLVYAALTACVVGFYVLIVGYLGALLRTDDNLAVSLAATGVVAVLFAPLRERLQRGVNRLMYGERDDPYAVVSRLGGRLESALAPDAVLPTIVGTVREALRLPYAAIALGEETPEVAASAGEPVRRPLRLPLVYRGETVGELLLGPRGGEDGFSPADRRLLSDLARQAGIAVHAARLTADLQRSRERLVAAREEERRRLRRDLHDGLGAQLAGLNIQAGVLRGLIERDPAAADALVVELRHEMRSAIADIRRLVHGLRPPALDELGLVGALERLAERHGAESGGVRVSVAASEVLPPLPAAVEVAAYRIAQEALTNVVRHARGQECVVRLAAAANEAYLEVRDDGVGFPDENTPGVGLCSMRERAAELGGECVVELAPGGGTRVRARLPLQGGG